MNRILQSQAISRRQFLQACGVGSGLILARPVLNVLSAKDSPTGPSLIVREKDPFNAEPDLPGLVENWLTPVDRFFVRNHGNIPALDPSEFKLQIAGLVDSPLTLSLDELTRKFTSTSTTATITCAGNRRSEFADPRIKGVPWQAGAIGNAEWSGVKLAEVLKAAGLKADAKHVWFVGSDQVKHKDEMIPFGASIPIERVMELQGDAVGVLLATTMNGRSLTPEHGAPLRAVTPGYIGARSVKWLRRIVVSDQPSSNHFVAHAYKIVEEDTLPIQEAAEPIYEYVLNSAIATLARSNGQLRVSGYSLPSGKPNARIKGVELSTDGGLTWQAAKLDKQAGDFCWQLWKAEVALPADDQRLLVRAIDSTALTQPRTTPFNAKGYQYNSWHAVKF